MKKYFIYAVSALALAGCSSDDFLGGQPSPTKLTDNNVINFNGGSSATTRSELTGSTAAGKLGGKFFVYGTKVNAGQTEGTDETKQQVVYTNYLVQFNDGTANTTVSNTAGWEYVGFSNSFASAFTPNVGNQTQTIKYWDYSAPSYVFYACSADENDLLAVNGKVKIKKITIASSIYEKGYEVFLKEGAHPENLYFSDRKVLTKSTNAVHGKEDVYGGEVNLTFRNSMAKVRVAFYETIPGYSVTINKFYTASGDNETKFVADLTNTPLVMSDTENGTKYKVVYYESGDLKNQPRLIATDVNQTTGVLTLGTGLFVNPLGTDKSTPTYDTNNGAYTWFMPQTENKSKLKLKVDYTLTSTDGSKETINVTGATAEVPAELLCWKPNYAYTYLFKISDNTNGSTGGGVTGLYPITFDAIVTETEDGLSETITTVSYPSITTYAKGAVDKDEYKAGFNIYVSVMKATGMASLVAEGDDANCALYTAVSADYIGGITESTVANCLVNGTNDSAAGTWTATDAKTGTLTVTKVTTGLSATKTIDAADTADGNAITSSKVTFAKFTPNAETYVFEFTDKYDHDKKYYKVIKVVD